MNGILSIVGVSPGLSSFVGSNCNIKSQSLSHKFGGKILSKRKEVPRRAACLYPCYICVALIIGGFPGCFRVAKVDGAVEQSKTTSYLTVQLSWTSNIFGEKNGGKNKKMCSKGGG